MAPHSTIGRAGRHWGYILTPKSRASVAEDGRIWCADNGAFSGAFDWRRFSAWLASMRPWADRCAFVAVPDVVANAAATLDRFRWYAWQIKALGFPVALVAQDGIESLRWPPEFDALFIGGSTAWKMSTAADWCIGQAKARGAWVHVGRVNSQRRIRHFQAVGVDSVDGTTIAFSPDKMYRRLERVLLQKRLVLG